MSSVDLNRVPTDQLEQLVKDKLAVESKDGSTIVVIDASETRLSEWCSTNGSLCLLPDVNFHSGSMLHKDGPEVYGYAKTVVLSPDIPHDLAEAELRTDDVGELVQRIRAQKYGDGGNIADRRGDGRAEC